ncbi:MAG: hypothetical protein L0Y58_25865 [Verrucomicrobia subdivision 3 bacterium]|nr:hypothetical protein [Limisphaerales bacterium]
MLAGLCGALFGLARCLTLVREIRFLHLGLRGEQAVAEALMEVAMLGTDPSMIFPRAKTGTLIMSLSALGAYSQLRQRHEANARAPPGKRDEQVLYDGKVLIFPSYRDDKAVIQAEANARWLAKYLRDSTADQSIWVSGLLVIPGWYVDYTTSPRGYPEIS